MNGATAKRLLLDYTQTIIFRLSKIHYYVFMLQAGFRAEGIRKSVGKLLNYVEKIIA